MKYPFPQKEDALAPGIYFGLPEELYHADSALSRSGMAALILDTPFEFWLSSWMNPELQHHAPTDAMKWGSAFHMFLLEPERWKEEYFVYPGDVFTLEKKKITKVDFQPILNATNILKSLPVAKDLLKGGYSEVTIVWRDPETGLMLRARLDQLIPFAIIDIKTAYSLRDKTLKYQFKDHFYHLQYVMYMEGVSIIRDLLKQDKCDVYGEVDDEWLSKFMNWPELWFFFLMQKKKYPYPVRVIQFLSEYDVQMGGEAMREGINMYIKNLEKYGTNAWPVSEGRYETFSTQFGTLPEVV